MVLPEPARHVPLVRTIERTRSEAIAIAVGHLLEQDDALVVVVAPNPDRAWLAHDELRVRIGAAVGGEQQLPVHGGHRRLTVRQSELLLVAADRDYVDGMNPTLVVLLEGDFQSGRPWVIAHELSRALVKRGGTMVVVVR